VLDQFNSNEREANCMFSSALATTCRILLDDLRAAPFSFTTGKTIRMKVFATAL
jgi:hypothetical protein